MTTPGVPIVVHVVIALEPGGLERLVVAWTNARNRQHPGSTAVWCLDAPGALAPAVDGDAVRTLHARRRRFPWDRAAVRRLRAWLQEGVAGGPIAVLHSHNLAAQQYVALALRGRATGHVHTEHGSNVFVTGLKNRLRHRVLARMTDRMVAVSADTARHMAPVWGLPPDRLAVIANGVAPAPPPDDERRRARRRDLGIPSDRVVLGGVGRLARVKGYDRLIEILPDLVRARPDVLLVLAGDGPDRAALESRAAALGVASHVRFLGYRPEAHTLFPAFDVYVAPSRSEGLPLALLEAMAAGCPVLVTDTGDQRAVIADGQCGALLPAATGEWTATILEFLRPQGLAAAAERAAAARQRVAAHYSLADSLAAYERIYHALSPMGAPA